MSHYGSIAVRLDLDSGSLEGLLGKKKLVKKATGKLHQKL